VLLFITIVIMFVNVGKLV